MQLMTRLKPRETKQADDDSCDPP